MRICLKSNSEADVSGAADVSIGMPGGDVRRKTIPFQLAAHSETTLDVQVGDAPVGTSAFAVRLEVMDASCCLDSNVTPRIRPSACGLFSKATTGRILKRPVN